MRTVPTAHPARRLRPVDPKRPRTRLRDLAPVAVVHVDRSNPTAPAGSDPSKLVALAQLEPARRGRHADQAALTSPGGYRWPRR